MLDAVLLEWEGVLADTASARRDALSRALAAEGIRVDAPSWFAQTHAESPHDAISSALAQLGRADPTLADLVAARATRAFAERLGQGFVLLPGAREFVERVQLTTRIAIVTSATRAETEFMLTLAGLESAVSLIVSADDDLDASPSPVAFDRALDHLSRRRPLHRDRVVAIAPTSSALRAARAVGVRTIAIGAPAHVALDADGAVDSINGLASSDLARLAGIPSVEPQR
jgi:beta-phosphoglucomutase-like phosphatase (HAD superfamily)